MAENTELIKGAKLFQKSKRHLKLLGVRKFQEPRSILMTYKYYAE